MHPIAIVTGIIGAIIGVAALLWQIANRRRDHTEKIDVHPYFATEAEPKLNTEVYATVTNISRVNVFVESVTLTRPGATPSPIGAPDTWLRSNEYSLHPVSPSDGLLRPNEARTYSFFTKNLGEKSEAAWKWLMGPTVVHVRTSTGLVVRRDISEALHVQIGVMLASKGLLPEPTQTLITDALRKAHQKSKLE